MAGRTYNTFDQSRDIPDEPAMNGKWKATIVSLCVTCGTIFYVSTTKIFIGENVPKSIDVVSLADIDSDPAGLDGLNQLQNMNLTLKGDVGLMQPSSVLFSGLGSELFVSNNPPGEPAFIARISPGAILDVPCVAPNGLGADRMAADGAWLYVLSLVADNSDIWICDTFLGSTIGALKLEMPKDTYIADIAIKDVVGSKPGLLIAILKDLNSGSSLVIIDPHKGTIEPLTTATEFEGANLIEGNGGSIFVASASRVWFVTPDGQVEAEATPPVKLISAATRIVPNVFLIISESSVYEVSLTSDSSSLSGSGPMIKFNEIEADVGFPMGAVAFNWEKNELALVRTDKPGLYATPVTLSHLPALREAIAFCLSAMEAHVRFDITGKKFSVDDCIMRYENGLYDQLREEMKSYLEGQAGKPIAEDGGDGPWTTRSAKTEEQAELSAKTKDPLAEEEAQEEADRFEEFLVAQDEESMTTEVAVTTTTSTAETTSTVATTSTMATIATAFVVSTEMAAVDDALKEGMEEMQAVLNGMIRVGVEEDATDALSKGMQEMQAALDVAAQEGDRTSDEPIPFSQEFEGAQEVNLPLQKDALADSNEAEMDDGMSAKQIDGTDTAILDLQDQLGAATQQQADLSQELDQSIDDATSQLATRIQTISREAAATSTDTAILDLQDQLGAATQQQADMSQELDQSIDDATSQLATRIQTISREAAVAKAEKKNGDITIQPPMDELPAPLLESVISVDTKKAETKDGVDTDTIHRTDAAIRDLKDQIGTVEQQQEDIDQELEQSIGDATSNIDTRIKTIIHKVETNPGVAPLTLTEEETDKDEDRRSPGGEFIKGIDTSIVALQQQVSTFQMQREQVDEELTAAIADVRTHLEEHDDDQKEQLGAQKEQMTTLTEQMVRLQTAVSATNERVGDMGTELAARVNNDEDLEQEREDGISSNSDSNSAAIQNIAATLESSFEALGNRLDATDSRVENIAGMLQTVLASDGDEGADVEPTLESPTVIRAIYPRIEEQPSIPQIQDPAHEMIGDDTTSPVVVEEDATLAKHVDTGSGGIDDVSLVSEGMRSVSLTTVGAETGGLTIAELEKAEQDSAKTSMFAKKSFQKMVTTAGCPLAAFDHFFYQKVDFFESDGVYHWTFVPSPSKSPATSCRVRGEMRQRGAKGRDSFLRHGKDERVMRFIGDLYVTLGGFLRVEGHYNQPTFASTCSPTVEWADLERPDFEGCGKMSFTVQPTGIDGWWDVPEAATMQETWSWKFCEDNDGGVRNMFDEISDDACSTETSRQRAPCVFPFTFKGKAYTGCTSTEKEFLWCALEPGRFDSFGTSRWAACDVANQCQV